MSIITTRTIIHQQYKDTSWYSNGYDLDAYNMKFELLFSNSFINFIKNITTFAQHIGQLYSRTSWGVLCRGCSIGSLTGEPLCPLEPLLWRELLLTLFATTIELSQFVDCGQVDESMSISEPDSLLHCGLQTVLPTVVRA